MKQLKALCICGMALLLALWAQQPAGADDGPVVTAPTASAPADRQVWKVSVHQDGSGDPAQWQPITEEQQKANITDLERKSRAAFGKANVKMRLEETPHFLVYHQLAGPEPPDPAIARYLEQAYTNLAQLFGLRAGEGQGANIWFGKAVLYDMSSWNDSENLVDKLHDGQSQLRQPCVILGNDGSVRCVLFHGDGGIGDYRNAVMAVSVGFLYRLQSPAPLPAWMEIGLPAALADSMQYQPRWQYGNVNPPPAYLAHAQLIAADDLAIMDDLSAVLDETAPTYPDFSVYECFAAYLLQKDHSRFGSVILDVKDGKNWRESIEMKLKTPFKKMDAAFRASLPRLGN